MDPIELARRVGMMFYKAELEQWFLKLKLMMRSFDDADE